MGTALYPGSFDPFHVGHLSVVEQVAACYERVVVAALGNAAKPGFLPLERRARLIAAAVAHLPNVEAVYGDGLTVDMARRVGAGVIVRAAGKEVRTELVMAATNRAVAGIETVLVPPAASTAYIGSRHIRALVAAGHLSAVAALVPPAVYEDLSRSAP